ncbi:MAG: two-component sensor histidine kinase [Lachnospiraceae bacterium]|nr:two-component sensor histidine kinase [Lachnospiraceae bacterium]
MKKRINIQFLCIAFLAILVTVSSLAFIFYDILKKEVIKDLKTYARLLVDTKAHENIEETLYVSKESDLRVTLINNDGKVIYDNNADVGIMNNHGKRPEVLEAMENGTGYDVRKSDTMEKNTFYYALKVNDDIILRVAKESNSLISVYKTSVPFMILVVILLMFLCVILSHYLTKSIMKPIEQMANNIDDCSNISTYKELKPFLTTIQKQHEDIVKNAHMRQDFTANVSHELKTPLTSISGYSELIENGMATNEDVVRFAKEIHRNSNRLLTLINDIIRLSELDTIKKDISFDRINLKDVALSCVEMLEINANKNNVKICWEGMDAFVYANKDLIDELTYNLCDNAIRYNKENGTVIVKTVEEDDKCILSVSDTGIGISKEHQGRIFERFYRVDKSRSKLTGGTGLGLAIVKHIIAQHENVELELESEVGKGTNMKVIFRKEK